MTELVRRVRDALPRQRPSTATAPAYPRSPTGAMRVEVRLPAHLYAACSGPMTPLLAAQLRQLMAQLGLTRAVDIVVRQTGAAAAPTTVSIDGHPVALVVTTSTESSTDVEDLCRAVTSRVLRRLPLLAGHEAGDRRIAAYLTTLGCRPQPGTPDGIDVEKAELLLDRRPDDRITLEVATTTLRRVSATHRREVIDLREREHRRYGVTYPDIDLVPVDEAPGTVRLRCNDVSIPVRPLGEDAGWEDVVAVLGEQLASRRHWFVRTGQVSHVIDNDLVHVYPDLVAATEANYSRALITATLRELVRSERRMRNLPRILWLLLEQEGEAAGPDVLRLSESLLMSKARHGPRAEGDPVLLAVRVRKMAAEEGWRLGNYRAPTDAVRLDARLEDRLVAGAGRSGLAGAEWAAVRALATAPEAARVITRTVEALVPVRDAVQALPRVPRVFPSHELPPWVDLAAFRIVDDPHRRPAS